MEYFSSPSQHTDEVKREGRYDPELIDLIAAQNQIANQQAEAQPQLNSELEVLNDLAAAVERRRSVYTAADQMDTWSQSAVLQAMAQQEIPHLAKQRSK